MVARHAIRSVLSCLAQPKLVQLKLICFLSIVIFSQTSFCQKNKYGDFFYPGLLQGGHKYNINDLVYVSWYSTIPNPILTTWARPAGSNDNVSNYAHAYVASNGTWPLSFLAKIADSSWTTFPVQLHMNLHDEERQGFNGVSFQVTSDPAKPATTFAYQFTLGVTTPTVLPTTAPSSSPPPVAPTTTSTAPQRTAPAFSTESAPPPPAEPTLDHSSSGGLSTNAKIGIGLGLGFGGLIVLSAAIGVFMVYRGRKRRAPRELPTEKDITPIEVMGTAGLEGDAGKDGDVQDGYFRHPAEVHAQPARYEVAA